MITIELMMQKRMNQMVTGNDLHTVGQHIDTNIQDVASEAEAINHSVTAIDQKLNNTNERVDNFEQEMNDMRRA